jgi:hypothetical protein
MKKYLFFTSLLLSLLFISCEEVVDVPLDTAAPRLVINATLKWEKGTDGSHQMIRLTTTTGYYDAQVPVVSDAEVVVTDTHGNTFAFVETPGTGEYHCDHFIPELNAEYKATITVAGQTYEATEILKSVPVIDKIEQEKRDGFGGDFIQIKAFYTDNGDTEDYYLFRFDPSHKILPSFQVSKDEFYQGNQIFGIYISEDVKKNDIVRIELTGISKRYYNYMEKIIAAAGSGGPFQSPGSTIRGNFVNVTKSDNYALGYFAVCETVLETYQVQ